MRVVFAEELTKVYRGGVRALHGVSLEVGEGEVFGLVGPNGAGKTTFIKVLLGLVRATDGRAELLGQPVQVGFCPDGVGYLPEKISPPRRFRGDFFLKIVALASGLRGDEVRKATDEVLEIVGAKKFVRRRLGHMSHGMLQRIGLAAALIGKPRLLFLDEPASGIDPVGRRDIRDLLIRLKEKGVTVFINSHILSELERVCDRVMVLHKGRVLAEGSLDDLTAGAPFFLIRTEPSLSDELLEKLTKKVLFPLRTEKKALVVEGIDNANALIRILQEEGVFVREMREHKETLEDVVVRLLREAGGERS